MITVPRHETDHDFARRQAEAMASREGAAANRAREDFDQLYYAHTLALVHAAFRSVGDPQARSGEIWSGIVLAERAGTATFALAATEGDGVDLVIGEPVRVPAAGSTLHVDPLGAALLQHFPTMKAFHFLAVQEPEGLNNALVEALGSHKKYWGHKSRAKDADGLLALGPLAVACIAHDLGIAPEVESEYIPKALVEGVRVGE